MNDPYFVEGLAEIESPALLVFLPILRRNLAAMLSLAGKPERLRPHVKTHKMPAIVRLLESQGIHKHKCATIAEAEMIAAAGGRDVLLSYPLVGPNVARYTQLMRAYPEVVFRATVDHGDAARGLARQAMEADLRAIPVSVDVNVGMNRTGISPEAAHELYALVASLPGLEPDGLHAYDGHLRQADRAERARAAVAGVDSIMGLRSRLIDDGLPVPRLVLGGTPTFPIHAKNDTPGVECSPGTSLLHDHSYGTKFPDLPFEPAAVLLGRVISKPAPGRICIDIGSKAVAADPMEDRVRLLGFPEAMLGPQSEEHLVVIGPRVDEARLGAEVMAIPTHICPTCALHREAIVVDEGRVVDRWQVAARDRRLSY